MAATSTRATSLWTASAAQEPCRRVGTPGCLLLGAVGGLVLGVIARSWMRLIADDPEFTWAGSIFIVAAFGIFGTGQALVFAARQAPWRRPWSTAARVVGTVTVLPLFTGAGAIMLPTVLCASLAMGRTDWRRWARGVLLVVASIMPIIVATQLIGSFGVSLHAAAGWLAMIAIYGVIIAAASLTCRPIADGWRLPRTVRLALYSVGGLLLLLSTVGIAGVR
jgi:hypothetical protein